MNKQVKIGSIIGYINMVVSAVVAIIYIPILTKGIGNSEYGVYQLMGSLVAYFTTTYTSLNASVLKNYAETLHKEEIEQQNVLAISRIIFRIISIIIILISIPVGFAFSFLYSSSLTNHELQEASVMFAMLIANILIYLNNNVYSAAIQAHERFVFRKCLDLISQCLQPLIVIACIRKLPYAATIVFIQICMNIAVSLSNYLYAKHRLKIIIKYHHRDNYLIKKILSLSISVLGVAFADQIFWKVDQLILGKLYGTEVVASYSISTQINSMYINIGTVVGGMILPAIISIVHNGDVVLLEKRFKQLGRFQSYILSFVLFGMLLYADELMKLLYKDYNGAMFSVLILLSIPYTIDLIQNAGNAILQAKNMYSFRAKIMLSAAFINIGLTIVLSHKLGMIGAALATAITIIITSGILMNLVYSRCVNIRVSDFWKDIIPIWMKLCPVLLLGRIIKTIDVFDNQILTFVVHCILYIIVFLSLLMTFGIEINDKRIFIGKLRKNK